jgi:hypothetical protein
VPADRPLLTAARCRVSFKTRPMKCPLGGRQPGHRRTPALAVGASASPAGSAVPPRTSNSSAASPSCPGVLPRHTVDAPTQPRCVASHGLRFRNRLLRAVSATRTGVSQCATRNTRGQRRRAPGRASLDSHGARALSDGELARADVVPMHRMRRVRPSGASVGRPVRACQTSLGCARNEAQAEARLDKRERGHCSGRESVPTPSSCLTLQRAAGRAARKPLLGRVRPTIGRAGSGTSKEKHQVWRWPGERDEGDRPRQVRLP